MAGFKQSTLGVMYLHLVVRRVREALDNTGVVLVRDPRQSVKATLAQQSASDPMPFITPVGARSVSAWPVDRGNAGGSRCL